MTVFRFDVTTEGAWATPPSSMASRTTEPVARWFSSGEIEERATSTPLGSGDERDAKRR